MGRPKKKTISEIENKNVVTIENTTTELASMDTKFYVPRNYARSNVQPLWASSSSVSINPVRITISLFVPSNVTSESAGE